MTRGSATDGGFKLASENHIPEIKHQLELLSHYQLRVGVFVSTGDKSVAFLQMIAVVNEYGAHIKPVKGPYLAVPNKKTGGIYLLKEVTIPPRPFMVPALDANINDYVQQIKRDLNLIMWRRLTAKELYKRLGRSIKAHIQHNIQVRNDPKNAPLTVENKGKNDPLVDTGSLLRSISWKVVPV